MSIVGQSERANQDRIVALFRGELDNQYLDDCSDRVGNTNIEERLLTSFLVKRGYTPNQISAATHRLRTEADHHSRSLYENNKAVYGLLQRVDAHGARPAP